MVVVGEAGVGKTRIAAELADSVRRCGAIVGRARCFASKGRLALAPVAEWLRSPALRPGFERLDPMWRAAVARLVPELGIGEAPPPAPLADPWERRQFFEGLARAALAADKETLLVLDDLQWCYAETLARLEAGLRSGPEGEGMLRRAAKIARQQGSRALELRAAIDLARRWVEAGRGDDAAALLAPLRAEACGCNPADVAAADDVLAGAAATPGRPV